MRSRKHTSDVISLIFLRGLGGDLVFRRRQKGAAKEHRQARTALDWALLQVTNNCDVVRLPLSYIHACSRRNRLTLRIGLSDDSGLRLGRVHNECIGTLLICAFARPGTVIPIDY